MDMQIPLNKLRFGHEDGEGINARVTGRDDGIAALAANLNANGQIENLIVKEIDGGLFAVANGNRRLAAFHMIHGVESDHPIGCTLHEIDETKAFEFSLTTAVTAEQLHPVDRYEGFARLRDRGQTAEEIARAFGMTEREVDQSLALGHLSPRVRDLWRRGVIKTEVAQAFTLATDHSQQDDILDKFAQRSGGLDGVDDYDVRTELQVGQDDSGVLVEFVGVDAYVAAGGKVTRDLFGTAHKVSDPKLAKKLAAEKLAAECKLLKEEGWGFAVIAESVRNTRHSYSRMKTEAKPTEEEAKHLGELNAVFHDRSSHFREGVYHTESFAQLTGAEQRAYLEYHALAREIELRCYTPKMMEASGCFVDIDDDGLLRVEFGHIKPAAKVEAAKVEKAEKKEQRKTEAKQAKAEGKPVPESTTLSNALVQRLEAALISATRDAIAGEPELVNSPLFEMLAKVMCAQIVPDSPFRMPDAVRTKLPSLRQTLNREVFNAALAKRFDAEDYFSSAPKGIVVKAIAEAINPDEARKASTGKAKAEIWKFALANVPRTGWLPKEVRTVHYAGPGSEGNKRPVAAPATAADTSPPAKPATTGEAVKQAKAEREAKRNGVVMKRAAAAKKVAKKASKKKR